MINTEVHTGDHFSEEELLKQLDRELQTLAIISRNLVDEWGLTYDTINEHIVTKYDKYATYYKKASRREMDFMAHEVLKSHVGILMASKMTDEEINNYLREELDNEHDD